MRRLYLAAFAAVLLAGCTDAPRSLVAPDQALYVRGHIPEPVRVLHVPRDYATIQAAVDAAREGDIIQVRAGTYSENVVITTSHIRLHASANVLLQGAELGGYGIHVRGTPSDRITGVEISGFEVASYARGIMVEWATGVVVTRNLVRGSRRPAAPVLLDGRGIVLVATAGSDVSLNVASDNVVSGMFLQNSSENTVSGNTVLGNGGEIDFSGAGIALTGIANDNRIVNNEIHGNHGRGIFLTRLAGALPGGGERNLIANNRVHLNGRGGIVLMGAVAENVMRLNDARDNAVSGLDPCYRCDLVDMSDDPTLNAWEKNKGRFNLTSDCQQP